MTKISEMTAVTTTAGVQYSGIQSGRNVRVAQSLLDSKFAFPSRTAGAAATIDSAVTAIRTDGYAAAGDGGGALYLKVVSQPAHSLYFRSADGAYWEIVPGTFDVRAAGAVIGASGATVTTAAVKAVRDWMVLGYVTVTGLSDPRLMREMVFGPGHYVINEAEAFMTQSTPAAKAAGFSCVGAGLTSTVVEYAPTVPGGFLVNNTKLLGFLFRNITFLSNDALNGFAYHLMSGLNTPQDFRHENVEWQGSWKRYYEFSGTNNCSEGSFFKCRFKGFVESGIQTNHDQNLNYSFINCDVLLTETGTQSCFIDAVAGGHFKFINTDFSGLQNCELFRLQGASHSQGVCFFEAVGCRFELKSDNCKVMECDWPQGTVSFVDCDFSSQSTVYTSTTVAFEFTLATVNGPQVKFDGCSLIGTTKINHGSSTFGGSLSFTYRNCDFIQVLGTIGDAFSFTSSTNDGGHPAITLESCRTGTPLILTYTAWAAATAYVVGNKRRNGRSIYTCTVSGTSAGSGGPTGKGTGITDNTVTWDFYSNTGRDYLHDQTLNWRQGRGQPKRRWAIFRNASGNTPTDADGDFEMVLPADAVVLHARLYAAAGAYSSGQNCDFTIQTWEASPTSFATVSATALSAGFDNSWNGFFECGTDILKWTLRLVIGSTVNQQLAGSYALVEYLA